MSLSLSKLDTGQLLILANSLAVGFSNGLTAEEIDILADVINAAGDLMAIIAGSQERYEDQEKSEDKIPN